MLNAFRVSIRGASPVWLGCALAAICFASPLGIFEKDASVTLGQLAGHADFNSSSGEYSLSGSGGEIGGKADGFHYLWKRVTGNVTFNADVRFTGDGSTNHSQAALMVRQSLDPDAAYAGAVIYGDGRNGALYRVDRGAATRISEFSTYANMGGTVHLSLGRRGDSFTIAIGRVGKRGGVLPTSAPVTVTMNGPVYVGLAFASPDDADQRLGAIFSYVSLQAPKVE
jgi:hypothetical protein